MSRFRTRRSSFALLVLGWGGYFFCVESTKLALGLVRRFSAKFADFEVI